MTENTKGDSSELSPQSTSNNLKDITKEITEGQSQGSFSHLQEQAPVPDPVIQSNIPEELKEIHQWVGWRYEWNGKKWTKPPYHPSGYKANKMNPDHYSDFSDVLAAYEEGGFSGIGFILTKDDPFVAIDIDHCLDGNILTDEARDIIKAMDSYTEISPSGTGIRIFVKGTVPRNMKKGIEIYCHSSYVTVTGRRWQS